MITLQWTTDFAKGQTDGKVPPEVKTQDKKKPIGGCTKTNKDGSQEWDVVYHDDKTGETTTIYYIKTKDKGDCGPWDGKYDPNGEGQAIKNSRYDVARFEKAVQDDTWWRSKDPDVVECVSFFP